MKLLNQSLIYLSVPIFAVVSVWAILFYFSMLHEIYDSIDDGLDNYKLLIIRKSKRDPSILQKGAFDESNYAIREIPQHLALNIKDVYQDTLMFMLNEEELEPVRMLTTAFQHQNKYYKLKVISSMVEEDDQIANLFKATLWLYFLLLLSIIIINNAVLQKLWQPFYGLLEQLKNFRIDKGSPLPEMETKTREFLELKHAADTLIDHTLDAYRRQKQFIENAAHELQTPLAIINNKLELLLEEKKLGISDAQTVAEVMQTTTHLIQLNRSLLFLSKIENKQFFENQLLSLNQVVHQVVAELEDYRLFKQIDLILDEAETLHVNMDPNLAHILVSNLFKNAIFHNLEQGRVSLKIERKTLTVSNTSLSEKLDEQKIFTRFYRTAGNSKSSGLGLAIVQAICHLYHFPISYTYSKEHTFTITFS